MLLAYCHKLLAHFRELLAAVVINYWQLQRLKHRLALEAESMR